MQLRSFVVFLSLVALVYLHPTDAQPPAGDPSNNVRKVRTEPNNAHRKWLENDVAVLNSEQERKAFGKLETNEEREAFIESFWRRRDPNPDTEENEFREEYY